jgi:hypothetical protein
MSHEHEQLLKTVKTLPEDYSPWGNIDRFKDENVYYPDCSMGCKFYKPLTGVLGCDWGVCANSESHRSGLLTFEHQGCQKFVVDDSIDSNTI